MQHGLPARQFLNPRVNLRTDEYGESAQKRLRIVREILHDIRAKVGDDMVVGIRISGDELSPEELSAEEVLTICAALDDEAGLDYFNVIAGTSTSLSRPQLTSKLNVLHDGHICMLGPFGHRAGEDVK